MSNIRTICDPQVNLNEDLSVAHSTNSSDDISWFDRDDI